MENTDENRFPQSDGSTIVQRTRNGKFQVLRETRVTTGEEVSPDSDLLTVETITITRKIGIDQSF